MLKLYKLYKIILKNVGAFIWGKNGSIIKISLYANHEMILPLPKLLCSPLKFIYYKQ